MEKMKLLTAVLFCLGIAVMASADEVVSIDLNGYGNDVAYSGSAAVGGDIVWRVYYGGWGEPAGSPRSDELWPDNEPCHPSIYAAQVWVGDLPGGNTYPWGSGTGLMDDGFRKDPCATEDPNIRLWGRDAYGGTFDIYVYGSEDGNFTITNPIATVNDTNSVDGNVAPGQFANGHNYVVFRDIPIGDEPNDYILLSYDNFINGLQLVEIRQPVSIHHDVNIISMEYDVAADTNRRIPPRESGGEGQFYGPDGNAAVVFWIDSSEFMEYDITVDEANEGRYDIYAWVNTGNGLCDNLNIFVDDIPLGVLVLDEDSTAEEPNYDPTINYVTVNLFEGNHTFKWAHIGGTYGYNLSHFKFVRHDPCDILMNDCNDVQNYGFRYAADFSGDCYIDFDDVAFMADDWVGCNDPNADNCP